VYPFVPTVRQVNFSLHPARLYLLRSQSSLPNAYTDNSLTLIRQNPSIPYCTSTSRAHQTSAQTPPERSLASALGKCRSCPGEMSRCPHLAWPLCGVSGARPAVARGILPRVGIHDVRFIYNVLKHRVRLFRCHECISPGYVKFRIGSLILILRAGVCTVLYTPHGLCWPSSF
jgi:hypothetical protein